MKFRWNNRLPAANITVGAEATDTEATNSEGDV